MWDIRGWNRLTVHDDPPLVARRDRRFNRGLQKSQSLGRANGEEGSRARWTIHTYLCGLSYTFITTSKAKAGLSTLNRKCLEARTNLISGSCVA